MSEIEIAKLAANAASEKKAQELRILDIRELCVFADYFVICHGSSQTQVQAIAQEVKGKMNESDIPIKGMEGYQEARWVLIDLGDVIVHVFHRDEREFYNLERLWADAQSIQVQ